MSAFDIPSPIFDEPTIYRFRDLYPLTRSLPLPDVTNLAIISCINANTKSV
jgi:hypothetical protein